MKACLLISGQMRTYKKCFRNILNNIINTNSDYDFDIYIFTEFYENNGGTAKNNFKNYENTLEDFRKNIQETYGNLVKSIIIESKENKIYYPPYINNYGPFLCLYKNKLCFDSVPEVENYDIYIRTRPDVVLTGKLDLHSLSNNHNTIHIITGNQTRVNSWLHNRDWDHIAISEKNGMQLWCDYYKFLEHTGNNDFTKEIRFNNNGSWQRYSNDRSIIATQLFMQHIQEKNYTLNFDALNVFTIPIR